MGKTTQATEVPRIVGFLLAILGGFLAIGIAIGVTHNSDPLWAIILLIWGLERVKSAGSEYRWKPTVLGLVLALGYVGLGIVAYYLHNANVLWAMILVNWLADSIINKENFITI